MTTATQPREPQMGLTFEKVWAMFQASDERMQKLSEEADQRMQKNDERFQKLREETDRIIQETAQQIKETEKLMKATIRQMKETDKQIGNLSNRFGELAEHLVAPNIIQKFNALGFHFNDVSAGYREIFVDESEQITAEFDILLENGEFSIAVEVKAQPTEQDVRDHVRRLGVLRRHKDKTGDKRKIYGALAGAIMPASVKAYALKTGFYIIKQTGDTVKIDIPKDFTPKIW
jgi:hypothetical protein